MFFNIFVIITLLVVCVEIIYFFSKRFYSFSLINNHYKFYIFNTLLNNEEVNDGCNDELSIDAVIDNMTSIYNFVNDFLDKNNCLKNVKNVINTAIDEIFSNIVNYAYKDQKGKVSIFLKIENDVVSITFKDNGIPFNFFDYSEPNVNTPYEERKPGGLGLFIVKKTMDFVKYQYENNCNILTIYKKIK